MLPQEAVAVLPLVEPRVESAGSGSGPCLPASMHRLTPLSAPCCAACSRKRLDASTGQQRQEQEILEIAVRPGWKAGTKITFQEKGGWPCQLDAAAAVWEGHACRLLLPGAPPGIDGSFCISC